MYFAAEDNNAIDDTSVTRPTMTLYDLMAARKVLAHSCQHAKAIMKVFASMWSLSVHLCI